MSYKYNEELERMVIDQHCGDVLLYVKEQTPEICLKAVKQNGLALYFVKEQTPEICLAAVKQNGYAVEFVEKQTYEICEAAVNQNCWAADYLNDYYIHAFLPNSYFE